MFFWFVIHAVVVFCFEFFRHAAEVNHGDKQKVFHGTCYVLVWSEYKVFLPGFSELISIASSISSGNDNRMRPSAISIVWS